jgi:hypothetical protein
MSIIWNIKLVIHVTSRRKTGALPGCPYEAKNFARITYKELKQIVEEIQAEVTKLNK